ncbi:hypothetical protein DIZ81_11185 [Legionella taurinensis]|uniref:LegC3 N-terminal Legionellaceae domain-containing protein n=1 Tax=Legionella taurinensis TaxID=70611 RepID=A0A3A5L405_9GAMM|nr:hypothetical protein [Legionella taurinensis]MDX1838416.1 hypothetical protein [Legionella taurinensis]PUT39168.1 hypothetical protein DB744_11195 [Legionella taurinensis]PUT39793.1 hypothetical protein DB746_13370 [Legionella taurinensis]PUT43625.1 hypothetical protein DB743_10590 [Legionella taurinensis]PUT45280.1 hypothetical protein DB745_13310 [Legionella taurinensis]
MPLATLDIHRLVREKTKVAIDQCGYEQLRNLCLEVRPLESVIQAVAGLLSTECEKDKTESKELLTQAFFKQQEEEDSKEDLHDKREAEKDRQLAESLSQALNRLNKQIIQEQSHLDTLALHHQGISNQLLDLNRQISQLESIQHSHGHPTGTHHHGHAVTSHHHEHTPLSHHHGHAVVSHHPSEDWQALTSRRSHLEGQCRNAELDVCSAKTTLSQLKAAYDKNSTELDTIPRREKERQQRSFDRETRTKARSEGTMNQLSEKKRKALEKDILFCHNKLDQKKEELLKTATEISYRDCIDVLLHDTDLSRLGSQKTPLLHIASTMNAYLQEKKKETQEKRNLEQAESLHNSLKQALANARKRLQSLVQSNPQLLKQNEQLAAENEDLRVQIAGRDRARRRALIASTVAFFAAALGIGIPFALPLTTLPVAAGLLPLLFIPGGAAALALVGLLIMVLVFTLMNNASQSQLEEKTSKMRQNTQTWQDQTGEVSELNEKKIPQLEEEVNRSYLSVNEIRGKISSHAETAAFYHNKACQIQTITMPFAANPENFFPGHAQSPYAPSAPPVDTQEMDFKH